MSLGEFDLINKYFTSNDKGEGIYLGIGDDCALVNIPSDKTLAITTDTQNEGIHFFKNTDPFQIGYKSLLVNVSDLAAMGAIPYAFTLSLTLPTSDETWLDQFAKGLFSLAQKLNMPLIGGNTTKGDLSITITAYGLCDKNKAMQRNLAKVNDNIFVTGTLGLPGLLVDLGYKKIELSDKNAFENLYYKSMLIENRCDFGYELSKISNCAIDISDGLVGDLKHILDASSVGCEIDIEKLPKPKEFEFFNLDEDYQDKLALYGGGDYELLFTISDSNLDKLSTISKKFDVPCTCIGKIKNKGYILQKNGRIIPQCERPFEHF